MLLLGALLVASCCIVSFGSNAKADDKAGRLLSKASSWITSNTPAQWWNVQEVELVAKEVVPNEDYMEEDEGYFVDEINVIIQTMEEDDSITQNGAGRKTKLPESKPTKAHPQPTQEGQSNVQVVDKEIVSKLRESYMKNMREEDPNVMTVSDLTFRPNSVGPILKRTGRRLAWKMPHFTCWLETASLTRRSKPCERLKIDSTGNTGTPGRFERRSLYGRIQSLDNRNGIGQG